MFMCDKEPETIDAIVLGFLTSNIKLTQRYMLNFAIFTI